jgi:hypothetical protein
MNTLKKERFSRIFPSRVEKLRDQLRVLGNCSNKTNYQWNERQVTMAFALLMREYINIAAQFNITITCKVNDIDLQQHLIDQ